MKTVRNTSRRPLRVHLPQGKTLHLGLGKEGQINDHDVDAEGVRRLVKAGDLEILGEGAAPRAASGAAPGAHPDTHGHHPETSVPKRGDR